MSAQPQILKRSDDEFIAYHHTKGKSNQPTVIFLGGFMSDMEGTKAKALEKFCIEKQLSHIRFDYFGHGQSSGEFTHGTIGKWKENAITVIDELTKGKVILVGSSLGGWLMLLAALERPERILGLIGVASAPDFTEKLIFEAMTKQEQNILVEEGVFQLTSEYSDDAYPISNQLITEARNHLILDKDINITVPIRLLHGLEDDDVPYQLSVEISEKITSDNVCVNLIPFADHRMSSEDTLNVLCNTLFELVENYS